MSIAHQPVTWRQFETMVFDRPTELVHGALVEQAMPTTQHGSVCLAVGTELRKWARASGTGSAFSNDSHVLTEHDPDTVRGPDCGFVRRERLPEGKLPPGVLRIPVDLAVEVLSPSDRWADVLDKVLEYLRSGVREVWVLDPERRTLAIHQSDESAISLTEDDVLTRPNLLPGFSCPVAEFFSEL